MTQEETKKDLSKKSEDAIAEATKKNDLSIAMNAAPEKKQLQPDQVSPGLSKYENKLIKERYGDIN